MIRYGKCKVGSRPQVVDTGNARWLKDVLVKLAQGQRRVQTPEAGGGALSAYPKRACLLSVDASRVLLGSICIDSNYMHVMSYLAVHTHRRIYCSTKKSDANQRRLVVMYS